MKAFLYDRLYDVSAIAFNCLNFLLAGNLPPFGRVIALVEHNGEYLVLQRRKPKYHYALPGGFMRWRESPEETIVRETFEETGIHIRPIAQLCCISQRYNKMKYMNTLNVFYSAAYNGGTVKQGIEGDPQWVTEEAFREYGSLHMVKVLDILKKQKDE